MKFKSTRGGVPSLTLSQAILNSIASDGGLFVPDVIPKVNAKLADYPLFAAQVLKPWFVNDKLSPHLEEMCRSAFNFPIPLTFFNDDTAMLELFHGPTSAFKDVGARFLAECFSRLPEARGKTILVATSGDTGGAVAAAFYKKAGIQVVILYPKGKVSERQEMQLCAWGENVHALTIKGDFDDCQRMVKAMLGDAQYNPKFLSANSINIGRLLPQMVYYAYASALYFEKKKRKPSFIIPTGNLGNALAAMWAKEMDFPIAKVVLATNSNRPLVDYLESGKWEAHKTIHTLANAMDVGNPSNVERLFALYPDMQKLRKEVQAISVSDSEISETIRNGVKDWKTVFCPHTATAVYAKQKLKVHDTILVATAHAAKFESIVEPLIGKKLEVPASLQMILSRPKVSTEMEADLEKLKKFLMGL